MPKIFLEKNISAKNIYVINIFAKNIFTKKNIVEKNIFEKIFLSKTHKKFSKKYLWQIFFQKKGWGEAPLAARRA